jgi:hypothetical protein
MKVLAIADVHGMEHLGYMMKEIKDEHHFDAVFVAGDITDCGLGDVGRILGSISEKTFVVPGNCDPPALHGLMRKYAEFLHFKRVDWMGYTIAGLGGVSFGYTMGTGFSEAEAEEFLGSCRGCVFLTHQPPQGILDYARGRHIGSKGILNAVLHARPQVVISGHVHEARGYTVRNGTLFVNPGPARDGYAAVVDFLEKKVEMLKI